MVWTFLQVSEESALHSESGLDQSPIAKSTPTVKECSCLIWRDNSSQKLLSGMTSEQCQELLSQKKLTSSMEAFLVRTLALQDLEKAWMESEADYFTRSFAWPKKQSPNFYSLKMSVPLQGEVELPLPESLPKWGMIVDGVLYPLKDLWRRKKEKDGFCWPTPTASQAGKPIREPSPSRKNKKHGYDLQDKIGEMDSESIGKKINNQFLEWIMGIPLKWTEPEPWAIQFVLSRLKKRSKP